MKKLFLMMLVYALLSSAYVYAQTQKAEDNTTEQTSKEKKKSKFGSFMRKVGETTTGINMTNEPFAVIPLYLRPHMNIELVGCYGDKASGTCLLIFTVTAKSAGLELESGAGKAFDKKGNVFPMEQNFKRNALPNGVPMKLSYSIEGVPATLDTFELMQRSWSATTPQGQKGASLNEGTNLIEFRNIPIQWDVIPE